MRHVVLSVTLLLSVAGLAMADGPETGVVSGRVTDAGGQPLPGVTVSIEGDTGTQTAITNESGDYRFALLRPGSYVVRAELEGFQTAESVATVVAGSKSDIDMKMSLGTAEEITVTSEAPMVDKFNVSAGQTMQAEVGVEVTGENRTYYGVINFMPGVTNEDENADLSSSRPNVNGATWADSTVYIDGVDTTFARYGGSRVYLPSTSTTEVSLESGGLSAEYGRTVGSATNVIVKSGTNRYHGDFNVQRIEEDWNAEYEQHPELELRQSNPRPRDFFIRTDEEKQNTDTNYELGIGGPIARDKAWFFVSYGDQNSNRTGKTINGDFVNESGFLESRIVKLNFQPLPSHSLSASWIDTPVFRNFRLEPVFDRYAMTPHDISGELYTISYNASLSSSFFLEAKIADQTSNEDKLLAFGGFDVDAALAVKQADPRFPANPAAGPAWPGNNYGPYLDSDGWHNGWLLDNGFGRNEFPRTQVNLSLTQFASQHELKYGIDAQEVKWNSDVSRINLYSGQGDNLFEPLSPTGFRDGNLPQNVGIATAPFSSCLFFAAVGSCILQDYNHADLLADRGSGDTKSTNVAFYVRDRFTAGDHWTFNLGLRVENQLHENDIGREVMDDTTLSPRFSVTYDIGGNGKQLLSAFAGRAYHQLPQQAVNEYMMDQFNGYNGYQRRLYIPGAGYVFSLGFVLPGAQWDLVDQGVFDSDLTAYYKDEAILGYEWQFSRNWAMDAKLMWWEVDNLIGSTNQIAELDGRLTVFTLTANHDDYADILNRVREAASPENRAVMAQADVLANYQEPFRDYQALQLQLNRRFADNWAVFNNITFSEAGGSSHGSVFNNTNDSYGEQLEQVIDQDDIDTCQARQANRTVPVDCVAALTPFLGQPMSTILRDGKANFDRPIIFKSTGYKIFDVSANHTFTLGGHVTWQSGTNWERTEGLGGDNPTGEPLSTTVTVNLEPEGSRHIDSHWWMNLSGAWGFPLVKRLRGELRVEVQNVFDNQDQVGVTSRGEVRPLRRGFQRPRRFRALFALRF